MTDDKEHAICGCGHEATWHGPLVRELTDATYCRVRIGRVPYEECDCMEFRDAAALTESRAGEDFAVHVYAAAHQCAPLDVSEVEGGLAEVRAVLAAQLAATTATAAAEVLDVLVEHARNERRTAWDADDHDAARFWSAAAGWIRVSRRRLGGGE